MKIEKDKGIYDFEPVGRIENAVIFSALPEQNPGAHLRQLAIVSLEEMQRLHSSEQKGFPTCIAWDPFNQKLMFWPIPDRDTEAVIRFYPPLKQV